MLLLDFGNSRLKWRLTQGNRSELSGAVGHQAGAGSLEALLLPSFSALPDPDQVLYASVADASVTAELQRLIEQRFPCAPVRRIVSAARLGAIYNGYLEPDALGVDRLLAMGGARAHMPTGALLVVSSGTATTIDYLDHSDHFQGGVILPGLRLMAAALNRGTAQLPLVEVERPEHQALGLDTVTAMRAGIVHAQCGAIERVLREARQRGPCECVLSGGGGYLLAAELPFPIRLIDNLVLDGLAALASQNS